MMGSSATYQRGTATRRALRPHLDALEGRLVMSSAASLHAAYANRSAELGTISGQVMDGTTGVGLRHVRLQLINAAGAVVERTATDAAGQYQFHVRQNGAYVVHEVTPRRYVQTTPAFGTAVPVGAFAPGFGNGSYNYSSTNTDPAAGPVGPAGWANIAPAGFEPFESPINLSGPTTDLARVLSVNYNNAVPKQLLNNGHQLQVQFTSTANDTITAAGQVYNLAQFHYHDPAETTVRRHANALEEHFVNLSASGAEAVVTVFLKVGAHNNALDPILNAAAASLTTPNSTVKIPSQVSFAGLLPTSTRGWFYQGSLTTPPLSQPVYWYVFQQPITLDARQLQQYEQVAAGSNFLPNARPVQPLDGRRLNEVDYDVNFQNTSVVGMNFDLTPRYPS